MTRLSQPQAIEFIEAYGMAPDYIGDGTVEAFIGGYDMADIRTDIENFCDFVASGTGQEIDPDSYEITPDTVEGMGLPAVKIVIRTMEVSA